MKKLMGLVGIISFSITRLKHMVLFAVEYCGVRWNHKFLDYEIETDATDGGGGEIFQSWNHKFLDYEIETKSVYVVRQASDDIGWNHKFLDYEIETRMTIHLPSVFFTVGIISFSITRLKQMIPKWIIVARESWNHKFLDYEIETCHFRGSIRFPFFILVGIISFSITRLKLFQPPTHAWDCYVGIISFSITRLKHRKRQGGRSRMDTVGIISFSITRLKHRIPIQCPTIDHSWNHKFLDYEIETNDS